MEVDTNELLRRIGAVLRVISDKMDRLIEIGERVEGQVRLPSEEESKTVADVLRNDACIPSDAVADEPPKKWRILRPGEPVRSGDRVNAKTNPPSDPPNGSGWRPVYAPVGTSVCKDDRCVYARPVADEPSKEAEKEHPAGPMPDPGEGYRLVSKNPPEDLQPGDEYQLVAGNGRWVESENAHTNRKQGPRIWYRRKIEAPKPAWEPKVGDWVKVTRPDDWIEWDFPKWEGWMHHFDGKVGQIQEAWGNNFQIVGFAGENSFRCELHPSWLSPAEPPEPEYREPVLPADAGKWAEFSQDGSVWYRWKLCGCYRGAGDRAISWNAANIGFRHARIRKDA